MALACRSIPNCSYQRPTSLVLCHNNRSINRAALDRYSTIRSFFSKQSETSQAKSSLTQQLRCRPYLTGTQPNINLRLNRLDAWSRSRFHTGSIVGKELAKDNGDLGSKPSPSKETPPIPPGATSSETSPDIDQSVGSSSRNPPNNHPPLNLDNYSRFFRRLALSLPHLHRPTRDDFLNVASGFWQRLRINFKWFTIKSFRKFNADDISAFVTWFLMSQTLWILVGT
jgi:mitochondrial distribution and morphology protein 31